MTNPHSAVAHDAATSAGGPAELLRVAYPLILSTASATVMQFINRIFLSRYGADALAACVPAGILSFTIISFFMGMTAYTNAFVAQYYGRRRFASVSAAIWQGVWLGMLSWIALILLTPAGIMVIDLSGHPEPVRELERQYFAILTAGGGIVAVNAALGAFFTGRGDTKITLTVNLAGNAACMLLSWLLIFGAGPLPPLGIKGAGYAMIAGNIVIAALYLAIILSRRNRKTYKTAHVAAFNKRLILRLVKYGAPNGVGFLLDVASFTVFIFLVGNMDKASLAANNIIASINMIAFMPVIGLGMAALTLVGRYIGKKQPAAAERVAYSAMKLALCYSASIGAAFVLLPGMFVNIFGAPGSAEFAGILAKSRPLMKLLAAFTVFDGLCIVLSDAIKGAGDTRFQMAAASLCAWLLFVPGVYYLVHYAHAPLDLVWIWAVFYVFVLAGILWLRFKSGKWREIDILRK